MSLDMYLGETDAQTRSMNVALIDTIQSMEEVTKSLDSFAGAIFLQGKTYQSAKMYASFTFLPLAQGIINLCEELIRQNDSYPSDFRAQVATTDVVESKLRMQIEQVDQLIEKFEAMNDTIPLFGAPVFIYQQMKRALERKLALLFEYNIATGSNYDLALELADSVLAGLNQIHSNNGFNKKDGTFSTKAMNLDWVSNLSDAQYKIKVKQRYPEYFAENEGNEANIKKAIEVIKYEEENPEYVETTDEFLNPLEETDIVEIKFLMYTAEEPHRTLSMQYLDQFEIGSTTESGVFYASDNALHFNVSEDRENVRGAYFTFFHELGHAIDYYHGTENGDTFFSDSFESEGMTLTEHMHDDVENRIRQELNGALNEPAYNDLSLNEKEQMMNRIVDEMVYTGPSNTTLTNSEEELYSIVQEKLSEELKPDEHNNTSDVYGGVTVNEVVGKWGHHNVDYWIDEDTGERINEPNKEGFASYYSSIMIEDSEIRDQELASVKEYLPESKVHMDEMFESMGEGEKE